MMYWAQMVLAVSDTRAQLRRHFEVDRYHIVLATLHALQKYAGSRGIRGKSAPGLWYSGK